ncbi:hypothetical protein G9A89_008946 [Geosiphon pyriformis]|nr:hypothetical protein G9A89_008946 [Geosiphon pyriformis]
MDIKDATKVLDDSLDKKLFGLSVNTKRTLISSPSAMRATYLPKKLVPASHPKYKFLAKMAQYANLAYCPSNNDIADHLLHEITVNTFVDVHTKEIVTYFKGVELYGGLLKIGKRQIITSTFTFPKTSGIQPATFSVDAIWNGHVESFMPMLLKKIKKFLEIDPVGAVHTIHFVGHGVGGVYALLAGLFLQQKILKFSKYWHYSHLSVVTFGQPRVGLRSFAQLVNTVLKVYRVTNASDNVPHYPQTKYKYIHTEKEYWLEPRDCNCWISDNGIIFGESQLYECSGVDEFADLKENPECNVNQVEKEKESEKAHFGPYFGITFGVCDSKG